MNLNQLLFDLVKILIASDGVVSDPERVFLGNLSTSHGLQGMRLEELLSLDLEELAAQIEEICQHVPDDVRTRRAIFREAGAVCVSDEELHENELYLLEKIRTSLGLSDRFMHASLEWNRRLIEMRLLGNILIDDGDIDWEEIDGARLRTD